MNNKMLRLVTFLGLTVLTAAAAACEPRTPPPGAEDTIARETFVEAYYLLRKEAMRSPLMEISLSARDRILADLGLSEEELLRFADVWGGEGEVMEGVWQEVDSLLRADRMTGRAGMEEEEDDPDESPIDFRGVGGP